MAEKNDRNIASSHGQAPGGESPYWYAYRKARRVIVLVVGCTVILVGAALLVLPGPAFVVLPAGLAILATEFAWARKLLRRIRRRFAEFGDRAYRADSDDADTPANDS